MIILQVLNKILQTGSYELISKYELNESYFTGYEAEFNFIKSHYDNYGNVPDKTTFLAKFQDFDFVQVEESDKYLIDTLQEEHLYYQSVAVVQQVAELLKTDANKAAEYLRTQVPLLSCNTKQDCGTDIIQQANKRLEMYLQKNNAEEPWYITTGFPELDEILNGWAKGEEFVVFFARTGQGKSWVLAKTLTHAWQTGNRVGYISPEMSADKIGYRFDTLFKGFSNKDLVWGKDVQNYEQYIKDLQSNKTPFIVATPQDFQKSITVSKLRNFCITNKLDILGIDGITYVTDERHKRGDNKTIMLTNISEDLMTLSNELQIPILVVVQSNRGGVKTEETEGTPELENIRDSDGIAQNATKVIALRQVANGLEFGIKKHRDGRAGDSLTYDWDIDLGEFSCRQSANDMRKAHSTQPPKPRAERTVTDIF